MQQYLGRAAELCADFLSVFAYEDFGQALGISKSHGAVSKGKRHPGTPLVLTSCIMDIIQMNFRIFLVTLLYITILFVFWTLSIYTK